MRKFDPYIFFTRYITKWHFRDPPIQKGITRATIQELHFRDPFSKKTAFWDTLYKKQVFSRPTYTTKLHFRDVLYKNVAFLIPLIHQNGIFEMPYTKKLAFFQIPPIKQNGLLETHYKYIFCFDPPIQRWPIFDHHIQKMTKTWPLSQYTLS